MTVIISTVGETEDKYQAYGAWLNALEKSRKAIEKFPALDGAAHKTKVARVYDEVVRATVFSRMQRANSDNYYADSRTNLAGEINGPGTAMTFDFAKQKANFTPADVRTLEAILKASFPKLKINVKHTGRPRAIVHVGL